MKNKVIYIVLIILILTAGIYTASKLSKGTYSLDVSATVTMECTSSIADAPKVTCTVELSSSNILSINANYNIPQGFEYVSFVFADTCNDNSCVAEATSNGFAYGKVNGISGNKVTIGTLTVKASNNIQSGNSYAIGLSNIELCDSNFEMLNVNDLTVPITITTGESEFSYEGDIEIDFDSSIISGIDNNLTYSSFKDKFGSSYTYHIADSSGNEIASNSLLKTGQNLIIEQANGTKTYKLSIKGDITGDGISDIRDVNEAYRHYRNKALITDQAKILAGDLARRGDGVINILDVNEIYRLYKLKS